MVRAWYMKNNNSEILKNYQDPKEILTMEEVYKLSLVEHFFLNVTSLKSDGVLEDIKQKRGYNYEDEITMSRDILANYDEKMKVFFTEHLHPDDEIRLVIQGSGYFDIRDRNDDWIRIEAETGDMLILPTGIYHRFSLDSRDFMTCRRFFSGVPIWTAYNRPADHFDCRKSYLHKLTCCPNQYL